MAVKAPAGMRIVHDQKVMLPIRIARKEAEDAEKA